MKRMLIPINKVAAIVTGKGFEFTSRKRVQTIESKNPLPTVTIDKGESGSQGFVDVTGFKVGRLTVIGKHENSKGWVCRCVCGVYCVRRAKAIVNPKNTQERCEECRHLAHLKREEEFRRSGKRKNADYF